MTRMFDWEVEALTSPAEMEVVILAELATFATSRQRDCWWLTVRQTRPSVPSFSPEWCERSRCISPSSDIPHC